MQDQMEESIQYAKKYLEDILSFFGLNTDVYATCEDDVIELSVPTSHMNGFLIGQHGDTIRSLQYLVSNALKNNNFEYCRVNVDVADYKKARNERLAEQVEIWLDKVKKSGDPMELRPMNAADRRIVHKVAGDNGFETASEGEGRDRHVVIKPGTAGPYANEDEEPEEVVGKVETEETVEKEEKELEQNDKE